MKFNMTIKGVAAFALLCTVQAGYAYDQRVENGTNYIVEFVVVNVKPCRNEKITVAPHKSAPIPMQGACLVKEVRGHVFAPTNPVAGDPVFSNESKTIHASSYKSTAGVGVAGNQKWAVYGPVDGKFTVTRVVQ